MLVKSLSSIVSDALSAPDLDGAFQRIVEAVVAYLAPEGCWIALCLPADGMLEIRAGHTHTDATLPDILTAAEGVDNPCGLALSRQQPVIAELSGRETEPAWCQKLIHCGLHTLVCVPIKRSLGRPPYGVLMASFPDAAMADDHTLEILSLISLQVALLLDTHTSSVGVAQWQAVTSAGQQLHRQLRTPELYHLITRLAVDRLGFGQATLYLRDGREMRRAATSSRLSQDGHLVDELAWTDIAAYLQPRFRISNSYLVRHRCQHEDTGMRDEMHVPGHWHRWDRLLIPLQQDDEILGLLCLHAPVDGRVPDEDAVQALEVFANQAALAIANARLVSELEQRTRELQAFAYTASHDLKTPLTTIRGYAEALDLLYGPQLGPDGQAMTAKIQKGVDRMAQIIDELLLLSRASRLSNPGTSVDTQRAVQRAVERLIEAITQRNVKVRIATPLPAVVGHETWVEQIFANLIDNAIKYARADDPSPTVEIDGDREKDTVHIRVRDHGIGLTEQQIPYVFEMFRRFHQDHAPGTGLGLAIVQRAVENMGGRVWVESQGPNQGATFHVVLPSAD